MLKLWSSRIFIIMVRVVTSWYSDGIFNSPHPVVLDGQECGPSVAGSNEVQTPSSRPTSVLPSLPLETCHTDPEIPHV